MKDWRCVRKLKSASLDLFWVLVSRFLLVSLAMFDWNDEEINNIIWDEAGETEDHIVPYPEAGEDYCKKKEWSVETGNIKSDRQKAARAKVDTHGRKLDGSSNFDPNEGASTSGFGMDSWPNLSLSNAAKTDQDSLDTSVSNNLTKITGFDSSGVEGAQLDKDSQLFQNPHEVKEQGDFVDYGWANIGSFDDLDRIFSNDDPMFGSVSLGSAEELWSSSKDVTNSPMKSFPMPADSPSLGFGSLKSTSENYEIKTEYVPEGDQRFTLGYGKVNAPASNSVQPMLDHIEYSGGKSKPILKEEVDMVASNSQLTGENVTLPNELVYKQKKVLRGRKKLEDKGDLKMYHNLYGSWSSSGNPSGQFKSQFPSPVIQSSASSVISQQNQLQGPEALQYQQMASSFVAPATYGNIRNPYSSMPVLSRVQSAEFGHQNLLSGYEVSSGNRNAANKLSNTAVKPQTMTPQEKIEKLRRRQQMRAMLAIQKQQQQLGHQVSCSDQSINHKGSQENRIQQLDGSNIEAKDLSVLPTFDPNSPLEQDDSNTISLAVNECSMEDAILYRLQDVVSKLDIKIRLSIRDSLFRLAQSAMQRHYASDTSSTNNSSRDEPVITKEEISSLHRNPKMLEVETETNPIDRTVAHLLFYRPMEFSGKYPDTPESPASTKFPSEQKIGGTGKLSMGSLPETVTNKQIFSQQGSKEACRRPDPLTINQSKSSPCFDSPGNASNKGPTDEGARKAEASQ